MTEVILVYKTIIGIIIITIYLLITVYIRRKLTKFRKINKMLLRDSTMAGLTLSLAAYIFLSAMISTETTEPLDSILFIPVFSSFLAGSNDIIIKN